MKTKEVEKAVEEDPGITFTELKEKLGLENGQLQYHLNRGKVFQKEKAYVTREACKNCSLKAVCREECVKQVLNSSIRKEICIRLQEDVPKRKIAEDFGIAPSTLSYHLNLLKEAGIIKNGKVASEVAEERLYQSRQESNNS